MSGLVAARALSGAGARVMVVEKSGDIGGRLATRRRGEAEWNHGAPTVEASDAGFVGFLREQQQKGHAVQVVSDDLQHRFQGKFGMRELLRGVSRDLVIRFNCEVVRIRRSTGWFLETVDDVCLGPFDVVLTAIPADQLVHLLQRSALPICSGLAAVSMAPCWSFLLALNGRFDAGFAEGSVLARTVRTVNLDSSMGFRQTVVMHTKADWSRRWLDLSPQMAIQQFRRDLAGDAMLVEMIREAQIFQAHRWRYAFVENALGRRHLWNADTGLGHAGDWCLGPTAQDAYLSGLSLSRAVLGDTVANKECKELTNA